MTTDTPQTDRLLQAQYVKQGSLGPHNCPEWLTVHARNLERERDEWKKEARELAGAFCCFRCRDAHTPLYCRNCADELSSSDNAGSETRPQDADSKQ